MSRSVSSAPVGPMYRFEAALPELPVPSLEDTAARYLQSAKAFHLPSSPTSAATPEPSFAKTEEAVHEFLTSPLVKELQDRLLKRAERKSSWLSEWWNETAYFGWRGELSAAAWTLLMHAQDRWCRG